MLTIAGIIVLFFIGVTSLLLAFGALMAYLQADFWQQDGSDLIAAFVFLMVGAFTLAAGISLV